MSVILLSMRNVQLPLLESDHLCKADSVGSRLACLDALQHRKIQSKPNLNLGAMQQSLQAG